VSLNPVDYKPAEIPVVGRLLVPKAATPGLDFVGCVVTPAANSPFTRTQLVFGVAGTSPVAGGALSEFCLVQKNHAVALPEGVAPVDAATVGVAALTAYQSIVPKVKKGDKIFINAGSGGTGVFGIQIAKALGCYVATSCSTENVELCKSLGADEVVDYKKTNVIDALVASGHKFDHVVDNVGTDTALYFRCHEFMQPAAVFVMVGGSPTFQSLANMAKTRLLPGFLGGGKRRLEGFVPASRPEDIAQIGEWMKEGKVKSVIDSKFSYEDVPKAFERLKTGRTKGKIVIDVALETYKEAWME